MTGTAGEQNGQDLVEGGLGVPERVDEDGLHTIVQVVDDLQKVDASFLEVCQLFGEELVTLFERGEFLERERVDTTEFVHRPFGGLQSRFLLGAVKGNRIGIGHRHERVGAVFLDEHLLGQRHVIRRLLEQISEVQFLFVDLHLESVNTIGHRREALTKFRFTNTKVGEFT